MVIIPQNSLSSRVSCFHRHFTSPTGRVDSIDDSKDSVYRSVSTRSYSIPLHHSTSHGFATLSRARLLRCHRWSPTRLPWRYQSSNPMASSLSTEPNSRGQSSAPRSSLVLLPVCCSVSADEHRPRRDRFHDGVPFTVTVTLDYR